MNTREDTRTITELIDSLNNSIKDIHDHPTKTDKLPSNFEILVRGVTDSKAIDFLFSSGIDRLIENLFKKIESGDFSAIIENKDMLQDIMDSVFGEGSFKGPISQAVLNNIQASVQSRRYAEMKSFLGKTVTTLKKVQLIMKNLEKGKKGFERNSEEYKKYSEAVYAIKQVLRFAMRVYKNRSLINKKVFDGLNNIVHEDFEYDEPLI